MSMAQPLMGDAAAAEEASPHQGAYISRITAAGSSSFCKLAQRVAEQLSEISLALSTEKRGSFSKTSA